MKRNNRQLKLDLILKPEKYQEWIDVKDIVADKKVYGKGVKEYIKAMKSGIDLRPIIVIKHPERELYAVLDGHHRYWAQKEVGILRIKCAVIHDLVGPLFFLTKEGYLQPTPLFTKHVRVPFLKLKVFLEKFLRDPDQSVKTV
ncbi:ParB-like nuclease domain-containing protein [Candidatus Bathyarchaeota archaeon]|nr:ParB-like nuclease domain-containing protein [Candidatus Bathyarchaeota archaeon]